MLLGLNNTEEINKRQHTSRAWNSTTSGRRSKHYQTPRLLGEGALAQSVAFEHRLRRYAASVIMNSPRQATSPNRIAIDHRLCFCFTETEHLVDA